MLDIDTAIKHCLEVAEQNETQAEKIGRRMIESAIDKFVTDCRECAVYHRQLAEWLMEVKDLREENKFLISEFDRLIKEKGEQIAEYKRLLKSAINVLKFISCDEDYNCGECIKQRQSCDYDDRFKWRYLDEALKLIES